MKIWYQTMTSYGYEPVWNEYGETLAKQCRRVLRPETEVKVSGVAIMNRSIDYYRSLDFFHRFQTFRNMLKAEKEGFDAFAINCSYDPWLAEGREMLCMPVVGISQTSYHFAAMLGERFAIIASTDFLSERYRQQVERYGLKDKYLPGPYVIGGEEEELGRAMKAPEPVVERFKTQAKRAIADGASVLLPLPAFIATILYKTGITEVDGVMVLDPVKITVKMAETMADLWKDGIGPSRRRGIYSVLPLEERQKAFAQYSEIVRMDTL